MSVSSFVNITELIDRCPLGPLQIRVIVLCGLVALLDGLDLLAIGVAAPVMAGPLHIAPNQLGFVFSAALVGLMLGAFGLGPIADRYGRGCVLIYATATFGVFTLCTASAATLQQILLFRFLAGVGLGGSMPSFTSLAAEYTPRSNRQAVIGLLWTGFARPCCTPRPFALLVLVGPWGSADSVLLSDRSPSACSSTGVGRSAIALPHSRWPRCARLWSLDIFL